MYNVQFTMYILNCSSVIVLLFIVIVTIQSAIEIYKQLLKFKFDNFRCLLSAGSHAVDHYFSMETIEKAIIEEFGQCLNKIIEKGMQKPPIKTEPPPTGKK